MVKYDAFISHASEDKDTMVRPLANLLIKRGYNIWYDEFSLDVGDSLRKSIDLGLINSRFGIIILSKHFISKNWSNYELDSLVSLDIDKPGIILPIWYKINKSDLLKYSPKLANIVSLETSKLSLTDIILNLEKKIGENKYTFDKNFKLKLKSKKYAVSKAERELGHLVILSEQTDRVINKKHTIIRTKLIIQPLEESFSEFEFHHWQDSKGDFEVIRANIVEAFSGNIINNNVIIEQNDGYKFRMRCRFNLTKKDPLIIIFELKTTNYFPNLFKTGNGYTEFQIRYPIDVFSYQLLMPNNIEYQNISVFANNKELILEKSTEISAYYKEKNVQKDDRLKFVIINKNI